MNHNKIRISIGYPPIKSDKGTPLLSQNRQFQFFNDATYIYPMLPAYAASLLKEAGYQVSWMDGIAEEKDYDDWINELKELDPNYLLMETKAPVIKTHWQQIKDLKEKLPRLKIILVGDHITFMPLESLENSPVDYLITGGDYDFVVKSLLNHIHKAEDLDGGVYWRGDDKRINHEKAKEFHLANGDKVYSSGPSSLKHKLDDLPFIDRDLTKWQLYAFKNGNYKYTPGTYVFSGRDCWWNRCTFCIWNHTLNPLGSYRSFSPERLFAEVKHIVDNYNVKEIFDDAGTMFIGPKLRKFCQLMIDSGYHKKIRFGCNMRFNALTEDDCKLMAKAGFRFILYGMESANQKTLDKLDKGIKEEDIVRGARIASKAGLEPHATIMLGYPWESYEDARRSINLAKDCFKKGYFHTMQATIVIPYPGTPLWKECREKGWLLSENYEDYDMRGPVMKAPFSEKKLFELMQELYTSFMSPRYIFRKVRSIRSPADIKFFYVSGKKLLGHLLDFDPNQTKVSFRSGKFWKNAIKRLFKSA